MRVDLHISEPVARRLRTLAARLLDMPDVTRWEYDTLVHRLTHSHGLEVTGYKMQMEALRREIAELYEFIAEQEYGALPEEAARIVTTRGQVRVHLN